MAYSGSGFALRGVQALSAAVVGLAFCAMAGRAALAEEEAPPRVEVWSGAESLPHISSVYGGATWAPFGSVREDGFRVRGVLGYADYEVGKVAFGDMLIGYHKQLGPVTIKVFGGLIVVDYSPDPAEPWPELEGTELGAKGVLEAWWNIADQAWASLDLSTSSTPMEYGSRVRLGWRLLPELSAGLDGGAAGTLKHDIARIGAFLRYEWTGGEVSVSGGWAAEGTWREREWPPGAFATVSVLTRF